MYFQKREETFRDEEDDEYDEPLSADIEIVYNGEQPKLHGILKQRSSSESSDEAASSPATPLTPTDDELSSSWNGHRKSVHFNRHVDSTTFKTNSSVSSMKTALKSKRRRVRKNEEKKRKAVERQRRNSGGSEGSGSEEPSPSDSVTCSDDGVPDDIDEEVVDVSADEEAEEQAAAEKSWVKAGVESEERETIKARGEAEAKPSCKGTRSEEEGKILQKEEFRTNMVSPGSKLAKDVKAKLAQGPSKEKEDDSDDEAEGDGAGTAGIEKENSSQAKFKAAAQGDPSFYAAGAISKPGDLCQMAQESGASIIHVTKGDRTEEEPGGGESVESGVHEKSDVETILSWDDPPAMSNEHKTKCAVELQNAIMFDLDID